LGAFLIGLSVAVDRIAGGGVGTFILYLAPLFLMAWFTWAWAGPLFCIVCAVNWGMEGTMLDAIGKLLLASIFVYLVSALKKSMEREKSLILSDSLTGVGNRRAFYDVTDREIARSRRYKRPFTVAYMDIDNLKVVNYRFGHNTGDSLLYTVAKTLKKNTREADFVARFGGDEFAILMPETGAESSQIVISRLRNCLIEAVQKSGWSTTFSFGAVTFATPPESVEEVVKKAGSLMYMAKNTGTNTIDQEVVGS
jgi:diguanylate cyclase (GGDEF)-like protein